MSELVSKLRDAFQRKRYGVDITEAAPSEYDPDFDLFEAAADEIERLQALAGSVTSGLTLSEIARSMPSSRQVIRERIARLADGE